jgi:hypothetical protein
MALQEGNAGKHTYPRTALQWLFWAILDKPNEFHLTVIGCSF